MENVFLRPWIRFLLSTLAAACIATGIIVVMRDRVLPKSVERVTTVVSGQSDTAEEKRLRDLRERALPSVFAVIRRPVEGSVNRPHAVAAAIGLTSDGYLLTTLPLPSDALFVLPDQKPLPATAVFKDESLGIAIVKVEASRVPVARFVDSSFMEPGAPAHVLSPNSVESVDLVTVGIPDLRVTTGANELLRRFVVSGASGIPGSPIVQGDGVVGMMQEAERRTVLPSDAFARMLERFLKTKTIEHPQVGIDVEETEAGAIVHHIKRLSQAEKAGVKVGDIILSVEGETVQENRRLSEIFEDFDPSATVIVRIKRADSESELKLPLREQLKK